MRTRRALTPLLAIGLLACQAFPPIATPPPVSSPTPTAAANATSAADATPAAGPTEGQPPAEHAGLTIVDQPMQSRPVGEAQAQALSEARDLYRSHPDDFGYAWINPASGELLISVTGDKGQALAGGHRWPAGVAWRIRPVDRSVASLEKIQEAVTHLLSEGVPGAQAIYQATRDHRDNRIVISVTNLSDELAAALAARFGTEAIAIQITPGFPGAGG
jgi:hypothetical protein